VGFGADLAPGTLVDAYRRGIFPWPHPGVPLPWFSPDPRGVLFLDRLHVARSLRQRLRRSRWETTVDAAFDVVIEECRRRADDHTWITPGMRDAYSRLHRLGWAHSLEVWDGDLLVGGLYGVQVGGCFTGESMFHRVTDASKVALVDLVARMGEAGGRLVDVQLATDHLSRLGVVEVPRARFLSMLAALRDLPVRLATDRCPVSRLAG
jgi:leucyl/phenylalanyl-tRNA--protein transferase